MRDIQVVRRHVVVGTVTQELRKSRIQPKLSHSASVVLLKDFLSVPVDGYCGVDAVGRETESC